MTQKLREQISALCDHELPEGEHELLLRRFSVEKSLRLHWERYHLIGAAMPMIMERKKMVMVLLALGSNAEFKYPRFFQSAPFGPDSKGVLSDAFFDVAATLNPSPKTVALVGADAEFSNNVLTGARANAKKHGLQIVYDRSYPPNTVDYTPIIRAIQATNPDVVLLASYPPDSVGMVRAATELGLKTQLFGGANGSTQMRSETKTTCSQCGKDTTVPFRPTQGRPVFCRECFQQRRAMGAA